MHIEFSGAAREVTGSCHILRANGKTVLLDCGMFQGKRSESAAKNARLPLPVEQIDAVVLSHAHIDHSGRLPFLVRQGYAEAPVLQDVTLRMRTLLGPFELQRDGVARAYAGTRANRHRQQAGVVSTREPSMSQFVKALSATRT